MQAKTLLNVGMRIKDTFFDRAVVLAKLAPAKRDGLSRGGAFVRRRARSLLRRRKRTAKPGEPPSVHSNDQHATLKFILFGWNGDDSVIIGPVGLNKRQYRNGALGAGTVPELLENGGTAGIREKLANAIVQNRKKRRKGSPRVLTSAQLQAIIRKREAARQVYEPGVEWIPLGRQKPLPGQPTRTRLAHYHKHPFMGPALEHERPNFAAVIAGSISRAA